jgi:MFS family permease
MVIGITSFSIIGNIAGSQAHTIGTLIAADACNGVAAAGQLSFGTVPGELVPNNQRGPIIILVFMSSLPFTVFGPIIARHLIEETNQAFQRSPDNTPTVITAMTTAVRDAYVTTFHYIFYATIPFSVLLIVSCCFIPDMDEHLYGNVAKRLQRMGKGEKVGNRRTA